MEKDEAEAEDESARGKNWKMARKAARPSVIDGR